MRNDCQIDKRQVYCPNASTLGFGKYRAQVGDVVRWQTEYSDGSHKYGIGRMIGRVHYAPAIETNESPVRDWILVIALSDNLSYSSEQWINPENVVEVFNPHQTGRADIQKRLNFFFSEEFKKYSPDSLRQWSTSGFATMEEFNEYLKNRGK